MQTLQNSDKYQLTKAGKDLVTRLTKERQLSGGQKQIIPATVTDGSQRFVIEDLNDTTIDYLLDLGQNFDRYFEEKPGSAKPQAEAKASTTKQK